VVDVREGELTAAGFTKEEQMRGRFRGGSKEERVQDSVVEVAVGSCSVDEDLKKFALVDNIQYCNQCEGKWKCS
jgi:hypothetical protein